MPFTDKNLIDALSDVEVKMTAISEKQAEIREIAKNLSSLRKRIRRVPNNNGGFDVVEDEPIDTGTNKPMTDARQNAVWTESKARLDAVTV